MLLSASIIVKNEAGILGKCLASLAGLADEIVVVDTGSTDDTIATARRYTSHVYPSGLFAADTPLEDFHFGNARNEALGHCHGDWVLSIDADETFEGDAEKLRTILANANGHRLYAMPLKKAEGAEYAPVPRLFKRDGQQWYYRVHEMPGACEGDAWSLGGNGTPIIAEHVCRLLHSRELGTERSCQRNMILLQRQLLEARDAQDGQLLCKTLIEIGEIYGLRNQHYEALGYLMCANAGASTVSTRWRVYIVAQIGSHYAQIGLPKMAERAWRQIIELEHHNYDAWILLGASLKAQARYHEAYEAYEKALEIEEPTRVGPFINSPDYRDAIEQEMVSCKELAA